METRKKKLTINTALCDMTQANEESLSAYEAIEINAATIVLSRRVKELLANIPLTMNAAQILHADEGTVFSTQNGKAEITGDKAPAKPAMLIVNGKLIIHPGSEEALKGYVSISVNGKMLYPKSMGALLSQVQVNGSSLPYPDEAILVDGKLVVDELFALRARDCLYFVTGDLILADESLDTKALADKGTRFAARHAYIAQKLIKDALAMIDEKTPITPIPEGFAFVGGKSTLSGDLISRYGKRLFVAGQLVIPMDQEDALKQLEGLQVTGNIKLPASMLDTLRAIKPKYQELITYKGLVIEDKVKLHITPELLTQHPEGLSVEDCGVVTLDERISAQDILDKLTLRDCGTITCQPEQEYALMQVSSDIGAITPAKDDPAQDQEKEDPYHEKINTAQYQF